MAKDGLKKELKKKIRAQLEQNDVDGDGDADVQNNLMPGN